MSQTLITGGTGFVGSFLIDQLENAVVTSRRAAPKDRNPDVQYLQWDYLHGKPDLDGVGEIGAVVHLMGESIAEGRWNDEKKQRIRDSRVIATRQLVDAIIDLPVKPEVMVAASAVGFYGDTGEQLATEAASAGQGFLSNVCQEWERESQRLTEHGVRVVLLRIGIVVGEGGGAMEKLVPLFKTGIAGRLGNGKQWMSWIHVEDLVGMIKWAIQTPAASGPYNAVAPNPVRNSEFTQSLASAVGRYAVLPVPGFALRIALGEFANSLLASQRVSSARAVQDGYVFRYPEIKAALEEVVG